MLKIEVEASPDRVFRAWTDETDVINRFIEKAVIEPRKDGNHAICELHQFDMKTGPKDRICMHMGCRIGWVFFLTNLKAYLEHGLDFHSHNPKRSHLQGFVNS